MAECMVQCQTVIFASCGAAVCWHTIKQATQQTKAPQSLHGLSKRHMLTHGPTRPFCATAPGPTTARLVPCLKGSTPVFLSSTIDCSAASYLEHKEAMGFFKMLK